MILSLVPMVAISLAGGLVALLQAITQVQEQSVVHFVKLVTLMVVLLWGGGHAMSRLEDIFVRVVSLAAIRDEG